MSGGHFDYRQNSIPEIADDIEEIIKNNDRKDVDEYGHTIGYGFSDEVIEKFKEAVITLRRAYIMARRADWLISGDDGENSFLTRLEEELQESGDD